MDKPIPDSTSPVADHGSRFYEELAVWWPLISPPEEYAEEAETFRRLFDEYATTPIRTVRELGSGGGNTGLGTSAGGNRFAASSFCGP